MNGKRNKVLGFIKTLNRRSIRLKGYDYTQSGAYFVTLCIQNRECLFGEIKNHEMFEYEYAQIVREEWKKSETIRKEIEMGPCVIMPNHFHGIVFIRATNPVGRDRQVVHSTTGLQPKSLGAFTRKNACKYIIN